ncbi:hypothetical protein ANCCEY_00261 [Ancylostoma ceylanicum]|uniref:Uncharacterized protein n=1 Tax=Ancylostoma ceylanicum TaxID=53326 RepID=A0A0D6MAK5_9BILA|nr:hypothetical protein ANCCEY_00261 [Ancylostoma ceylanicum]
MQLRKHVLQVRDIFHKTFDYDKDELSAKEEEALTIELEKLYKSLVSADRKEMQVLHDQFKSKEEELGAENS